MSRAAQFLAVAALLRERYESAPAVELPLLAAFVAYLEALADQEAVSAETPAAQAGPAGRAAAAQAAAAAAAAEAGEPAVPWLPPPEPLQGTFIEAGWGGVVTADDGQRLRIPYSVVSAAGLRHGDRVRMAPKDGEPGHYRYTRTGLAAPVAPGTVRETVADLRQRQGGWEAEIGGRTVRVRPGLQVSLSAGDVVTLRYSEAELDTPDGWAWVIRRHEVPEPRPPAPAVRRRTVRRRRHPPPSRRGSPPAEAPVGAAPEPPAAESAPLPPRPRLLIIGGHERARRQYRTALARVADADSVAGTRLTKSLRDRLEHAEAVVVVTQHMSHTVSDYVIGVLRATRIPNISARSQNHSGILRQVELELLPQLASDVGPVRDGGRPAESARLAEAGRAGEGGHLAAEGR